jgi:hypothetical protein
MSPTYASGTSVTVEKSRAEIERTLSRFGATSFAYGWDGGNGMVAFVINGRQVRFVLPLPDRNTREFTHTPERRIQRTKAEADRAYEQAVKQRWRALKLVILAKLEAVEAGIVTFETEFAMHMILPDGRPVSAHVLPAIEQAYTTGAVRPLIQIEGS